MQPWAEEVADADQAAPPTSGGDIPRRKGLDLVSPTRTRSHELNSGDSALSLAEEPPTAEAPGTGADDDDYSAWLDNADAPEQGSSAAIA
jgi:hypothetical protein